jgi:hypothetical protein
MNEELDLLDLKKSWATAYTDGHISMIVLSRALSAESKLTELQDRLSAAESELSKRNSKLDLEYASHTKTKLDLEIMALEYDQLRDQLDEKSSILHTASEEHRRYEKMYHELLASFEAANENLAKISITLCDIQVPDESESIFKIEHSPNLTLVTIHKCKIVPYDWVCTNPSKSIPEQATPAESVQVLSNYVVRVCPDCDIEIRAGHKCQSPKVEQVSGGGEVGFRWRRKGYELWDYVYHRAPDSFELGDDIELQQVITIGSKPSPNKEDVPDYEALKTKAENWDYYQEMLKQNGHSGITDLLTKHSYLVRASLEFPHWVEIENPEDAPTDGDLVLWDGCDLSVDYVENEVDFGTSFFANGTEATHYLAGLTTPLPPLKDE